MKRKMRWCALALAGCVLFSGAIPKNARAASKKGDSIVQNTLTGTAPAPKDGVVQVTDYGADPSGRKDSTIAVQKALEAAKQVDGAVKVVFPKGEYHFYKDFALKRKYHTSNTNSSDYPTKTIGILIEGQRDLTLEGNGSLFIMHGNMMALAVVNSDNVKLHGFSWDFATPTTSEMTVVATGKNGLNTYTDFYVADNFHYEVKGKKTLVWNSEKSPYTGEVYWSEENQHRSFAVVAYDPSKQVVRRYAKKDGPLSNQKKIEKIGDNILRVTYRAGRAKPHEPGMVFEMCSSSVRETAGAFLWESKDVTVENVNVHYMHGFGWLTQMCENVSFLNCNFTPREGTGRYCTSFADLIHVSGAKGTLTIENCNFSHAHDDPINIHGTFTRVKKKLDSHTLELEYVHDQQGGFPQYHSGDQVAFYSRDKLEQSEGAQLYTVTSVVNPGEGGYHSKTMKVVFQEELPSDIDASIAREKKYVAENVTYTPIVKIKNCHFSNIPTRGILCTTRHPVVIENNTFVNMSMASIFLSNDSQDWYESGPIRDMTIRGNTFYIRPTFQTEWKYKSALYIHPVTKGGGLPSWSAPIHKNITVEDNTFYMQHDAVVKAESVENLKFRNNKVLRCDPEINIAVKAQKQELKSGETMQLLTRAAGTQNNGSVDALFDFTACKDILLQGNTYDDGLPLTALTKDMPGSAIQVLDSKIKLNGPKKAGEAVKNLRYTSTNTAVATVDAQGKVTARGKGAAAIYAYYVWNGTAIPSNGVVVTVDGAEGQPAAAFSADGYRSSLSGIAKLSIPQLNFVSGDTMRESYVVQDTAALNAVTLDIEADENTAGIALSRGERRAQVASTTEKKLKITLNLTTGINSFYIETIAADGVSKKLTMVHIIHMGNTKADANALELGGKPLEDFKSDTEEYTVVVPPEQAKGFPVAVTLGDEDQTASITINNERHEGTRFQADLKSGLNTVVVAVTAENMVDTSYYTIHLKVPDQGNTQLQSVRFDRGVELDQAFDPEWMSYTGASTLMSTRVTLEAVETDATIVLKVGKSTYKSDNNKLTRTISFFSGTRELEIIVTAPNGNERTYRMALESHAVATVTDVIFVAGALVSGVITLAVIMYKRKKALLGR